MPVLEYNKLRVWYPDDVPEEEVLDALAKTDMEPEEEVDVGDGLFSFPEGEEKPEVEPEDTWQRDILEAITNKEPMRCVSGLEIVRDKKGLISRIKVIYE